MLLLMSLLQPKSISDKLVNDVFLSDVIQLLGETMHEALDQTLILDRSGISTHFKRYGSFAQTS